ncbi:MAG TPA: sigma-70 family RNA polymerase sigma factor [Jiangellaceae bacterium]|nr:sigma-70 family RNA polymerase sigma factor [Jiangellaceae bacterium]
MRTRHVADDDLLRTLYDEHAAALLGFVRRLVDGDRQHAEDIVQETLLRAWRHPDALTGDRTRPWLFTVARNLVISRYRARRARAGEVPLPSGDVLVADDELDQAMLSWQVADALGKLTPAHRDVLVHLFFGGQSIAEAAAALGVPEGTVKSRSFYALRALRLVFEESGMRP